ncbi:BAM1 [Symbiodinium sp. CCMP2456]|nr:BAM1 [Symbiodinium sp. CCMP2456]
MMRLLATLLLAAWADAVEVFVMLGLDAVTQSGDLKDPESLRAQLQQLKSGSADGIMADVWWGATEPSAKSYKFDGYKQLVDMCKSIGLKVQLVTSFHQCGGNVGDTCDIPLPAFVTSQRDIWYKDQHGHEDREYISLFADNVTIEGRTPLQMYSDWFNALSSNFAAELGSVIEEIQVGMGPAGELRYPAYQLSQWKFCGVGAFQCYDANALNSLASAAKSAGHADWSNPPSDAGDYNSHPGDAAFFQNGYQSDFGRFFLKWYADALLQHGAEVLQRAKQAFGRSGVRLAGKVAGIHWWYKSDHHAAELTSGYYNANGIDAYDSISAIFEAAGAGVDFTCMEMADSEQSADCASGPEELVKQVMAATASHGIALGGENALPRFDDTAYSKIESYKSGMQVFTYLRLGNDLLNGDNWNRFQSFVSKMHSAVSLIV